MLSYVNYSLDFTDAHFAIRGQGGFVFYATFTHEPTIAKVSAKYINAKDPIHLAIMSAFGVNHQGKCRAGRIGGNFIEEIDFCKLTDRLGQYINSLVIYPCICGDQTARIDDQTARIDDQTFALPMISHVFWDDQTRDLQLISACSEFLPKTPSQVYFREVTADEYIVHLDKCPMKAEANFDIRYSYATGKLHIANGSVTVKPVNGVYEFAVSKEIAHHISAANVFYSESLVAADLEENEFVCVTYRTPEGWWYDPETCNVGEMWGRFVDNIEEYVDTIKLSE